MKNKSLNRSFFGTASLQLFGRGLAVITGVLFARALGPEEFGRYSLVLSIITIASIPAIAGLPQLIVREIARYRVEGDHGFILGMLRWASLYIIIISTLSVIVLLILTQFNIWRHDVIVLIVSALCLIPLKALLTSRGAIINGLQRPELAQFPSLIMAPLLLLILVLLLYFFDVALNAKVLLNLQVITSLIALIIAYLLSRYVVKTSGIKSRPRLYEIKRWQKALLPFTIITIVGTMNNELAVIVLGFLDNEEAIGYFKVATQGIILLALGLQAVNTVTGPRIASLYRQNKIAETQALLKQSVRIALLTSIVPALVFIVFGEELIGLLFGEAYIPAASLLTILCFGQIVNVSFGSVGLVLNMTGNERRSLRAQLITLCLTISLLFFLIPLYQATGAAIAVSIGLTCWNVILAFDVYRLTGLKTWIHF